MHARFAIYSMHAFCPEESLSSHPGPEYETTTAIQLCNEIRQTFEEYLHQVLMEILLQK